MKYAFTSFSTPQLGLGELLALAGRLGYDAVEPRLSSGHGHGIEPETDAAARAAIRRRVAEGGVALCCLGSSCRYTDPATVERQIADTRRCVALAADVGAPLLRVFAGVIPGGIGREEARERVVGALRAVAGEAGARGVTVCVETHDDWSDPRAVASIMRAVDHPAVGVAWDVMHPLRTGNATMAGVFELLAPWIRHVHIHDGSAQSDERRFTPIGTGDLDHREVLRLLRDAGYAGYLSGEWLGDWMDHEPGEVHLPRELATMRGYECELGLA